MYIYIYIYIYIHIPDPRRKKTRITDSGSEKQFFENVFPVAISLLTRTAESSNNKKTSKQSKKVNPVAVCLTQIATQFFGENITPNDWGVYCSPRLQ